MSLTTQQTAALKADLAANANQVTIGGVPTAISAVPHTADNAFAVAAWYNQSASPAYLAWNTAVAIKAVRAAVNLANYTPSDAVPASGSTAQVTNDQLVYQNRALACQLKQANAIFLVQGEGTVDATPAQFRQNFRDCMSAIPSGVSGANQDAGWGTPASPGAVRLAMQRSVTNAEKLFATAGAGGGPVGNVGTDPRGSATNPDGLTFVGQLTYQDVLTAWNS